MEEKKIRGKLVPKHELEADWEKSSYVPSKGEIVIYDKEVDENGNVLVPDRIKIGDGKNRVFDLPFATSEAKGPAIEEFDIVITSQEQFLSYSADDLYKKSILVKGVDFLAQDLDFCGAKYVEFQNTTIGSTDGVSTIKSFEYGNFIGLSLLGSSYECSQLNIAFFGFVENCNPGESDHHYSNSFQIDYSYGKGILNCLITTAHECCNIINCHIAGNDFYIFQDCSTITNLHAVPSGHSTDSVTFNNCQYLSNISCGEIKDKIYTNCTHVDVDTCDGYERGNSGGDSIEGSFDVIITSQEQLLSNNLTNKKVLIKNTKLILDEIDFKGAKYVEFNNVEVISRIFYVTLKNFEYGNFIGLVPGYLQEIDANHYGCDDLHIENFNLIENLQICPEDSHRNTGTNLYYQNGMGIINCHVTFVNNCCNINNCHFYGRGEPTFYNCSTISNLHDTDAELYFGQITFEKCSHLSNIKITNGRTIVYLDCFKVDANTCDGYETGDSSGSNGESSGSSNGESQFDIIITNEDQLYSENLSGKSVLIKNTTLSKKDEGRVNIDLNNAKYVEFQNVFLEEECYYLTIKNFHVGNFTGLYLGMRESQGFAPADDIIIQNFGMVENLNASEKIYNEYGYQNGTNIFYLNGNGIINSYISQATNCHNIVNCFINGRHSGEFINCTTISNLYSNVKQYENITFERCSYLSNISLEDYNVSYIDCTNVDSNTCSGYSESGSENENIEIPSGYGFVWRSGEDGFVLKEGYLLPNSQNQELDGKIMKYLTEQGWQAMSVEEAIGNEYYSKIQVDKKLGDIDSVLDAILAKQNTVLGGNS